MSFPNTFRPLLLAGLAASAAIALSPASSAQETGGIVVLGRVEDSGAEKLLMRLEAQADALYKTWRTELREKMKAAKEAGEELGDEAYVRPFGPLIPEFQNAANKYQGTEDEVPFLAWIFRNASGIDEPARREAFDRLIDVHAASPKLEQIASSFGRPESIDWIKQAALIRKLAQVEAKNPSASVRGWASFGQHKHIIEKARLDSEDFQRARATLLDRIEGLDDDYLTQTVRAAIGVRLHFSIGAVAPDIEGIDLDGTAFKLSDYRGKIVFVDFWGDW